MANRDLLALKGMLDPGVFAREIFGFHAQQAIEKSLKAWIVALGREYSFTHNIIALLDEVASAGGNVDSFWGLVKYNAFAVQFRYEQFDDTQDDLDRSEAIREVSELTACVKGVLNGAPAAE